ncbi:MAG TPA: CHAT domain-containing protein [Myxococcaceae bacterium]
MAVVAAGAFAWARWSERRDEAVLWLADAPTRALEPRLSSSAAARHRPLAVSRGQGALPAPPLASLARLEERGQLVAIADAYLLRGQAEAARPYLERAPLAADALATRAALDLLVGKPEDALRHADDALKLEPRNAAARWNRALGLRGLELPFAAAQELDAVAALREPGWSDEARALATRLREETRRRQAAYTDGLKRCRAAMRGEAPYPLDVVDRSRRLARFCFYDVLRAAGTVEAVAALEPAAAALDARFGGVALAQGVARVKAAASAPQREELSRAYARYVEAHPGDDEWLRLADAARAARQLDIELGALYFVRAGRQDVGRYAPLALATGDPWFAALAEELGAGVEAQRGQPARALDRLRPLEERCAREDRVEDRCLTIERSIAYAQVMLLQMRSAKDAGLRALARARADGDWTTELSLLKEIGQTERLRADLGLARAYLDEALARDPESCDTVEFVRSNLAAGYQQILDFPAARREVDQMGPCDRPPSLTRLQVIADLQRSLPRKEDVRVMERGVAAARADATLSVGDQALITQYAGRGRIEHDRVGGERLLRQAISEAGRITGTDRAAAKARFYSFTALLLEAGSRSDFNAALRLFVEEGRWPSLPPCSLWLAADDERFLAVAVGPGGQPLGQYDGARRTPVTGERELVPAEMLAVARACPAVKVVARPPLEGRPDLLPSDVAWSEVVRGAPPPPPGAGPWVVISAPEPPASLRLPVLRSAPPSAPGQLRLEGQAATPSRALEAMRRASLVEIHAHGLLAPDAADASYVALSPEVSGRFALTAADVRRERLDGHPLVLLAACHSAETTTLLDEGYGLPKAFIEAGARAVLAVVAPIPDVESEPFFRPLLSRIQSGVPAPEALREARVAWHQAHGPSWADSVLLFE